MIKNPFKRGQFIRVNDNYDNQDYIYPNEITEDEEFKDLPKSDQLTQNSWNFSIYTREDNYNDVTIDKGERVNRRDIYKGIKRIGE